MIKEHYNPKLLISFVNPLKINLTREELQFIRDNCFFNLKIEQITKQTIAQIYDELLKLRLKHIFVSRDDEMPDFENMTGEERKKNPIWQKMSPVERMYAAGLVTGLDGEKITYSEFKNGMSPEREEKIDKIRFERREKRKWFREFYKLNKKYGNTSNN